jgi:hypothetical protein
VIGHSTHRLKLAASIAAACLALSASGPGFAQPAPLSGSWLAGPDGKGQSTYVGRIEAPRAGQTVTAGANILVSGWAVDTTATGWSGIDGVEVWNGAKDKGGTKLASGSVGQPRPDVADALGGSFRGSGFSAVIPPLSGVSGSVSLFVYLHTPDKGTWYKSLTVNAPSAAALAFPTDPIVSIIRPQENAVVTSRLPNQVWTVRGIALDRNPLTDPGNQTLGACQCGISSVTIYLDAPRGKADPNNVFAGNLGALYGVNNSTKPVSAPVSAFSPVARQYGKAFDFAQWNTFINPATIGEGYHTLYVYARSSITGRETGPATVSFFVKQIPNNGKPSTGG